MRKLLFPALLLLATVAQAKVTTYSWEGSVKEPTSVTLDWSGEGKQPTWIAAIGDKIKGTFKIDDQAPKEDTEPDIAVYQNAATLDFTVSGEHFTMTPQPWFVNSQFHGLGTAVMLNDRQDLSLNIDWKFPKSNPLDLTLAEASHIVNPQGGYFGIDGWEGPVETNFNGVIDFITADAAPVPEPSTFVLMGLGLAAFGISRVRRRRSYPASQ